MAGKVSAVEARGSVWAARNVGRVQNLMFELLHGYGSPCGLHSGQRPRCLDKMAEEILDVFTCGARWPEKAELWQTTCMRGNVRIYGHGGEKRGACRATGKANCWQLWRRGGPLGQSCGLPCWLHHNYADFIKLRCLTHQRLNLEGCAASCHLVSQRVAKYASLLELSSNGLEVRCLLW